MKRTISTIIVILLCACVFAAGCSRQEAKPGGQEPLVGPSAQVAADIEELKASPTKEIAEALGAKAILKYADTELADQMASKMMEFDYSAVGEELSEDGQTAEVTVNVTTYDFGEAVQSAVRGLALKIIAGSIDREDTEAVVEYMLNRVLKSVKKKNFTTEVTFHCTLKGDEWDTGLSENEEFRTALQGGFMEAVKSYL